MIVCAVAQPSSRRGRTTSRSVADMLAHSACSVGRSLIERNAATAAASASKSQLARHTGSTNGPSRRSNPWARNHSQVCSWPERKSYSGSKPSRRLALSMLSTAWWRLPNRCPKIGAGRSASAASGTSTMSGSTPTIDASVVT